jgi:hypothetical protein
MARLPAKEGAPNPNNHPSEEQQCCVNADIPQAGMKEAPASAFTAE